MASVHLIPSRALKIKNAALRAAFLLGGAIRDKSYSFASPGAQPLVALVLASLITMFVSHFSFRYGVFREELTGPTDRSRTVT